MTKPTAFLGKLIGIYLVLFGLAMLVRKAEMLDAIMTLMHERSVMLVLALIVLGAGLAVVLTHNVWRGGVFPVVVTLIGWLAVLKGVALLFLTPEQMAGVMTAVQYEKQFAVYAVLAMLLGGYLTWMGCRECCAKRK